MALHYIGWDIAQRVRCIPSVSYFSTETVDMPSDKYELGSIENGKQETPREKRDGSPDSGVENAAYLQSTDTVSINLQWPVMILASGRDSVVTKDNPGSNNSFYATVIQKS